MRIGIYEYIYIGIFVNIYKQKKGSTKTTHGKFNQKLTLVFFRENLCIFLWVK